VKVLLAFCLPALHWLLLLLLLLQGKRSRSDGASYEAALADLSPAPVAQLLAAALAATPPSAQPACHTPAGPILLPGLARGSSSSSLPAAGAAAGSAGVAGGVTAAAAAGLVLRLVLISGWQEDAPGLAPPLYQRRLASWLRHKLAPHLPPRLGQASAAAGAAGGAGSWQGGSSYGSSQPQLVALGGQQQLQQQRHQQEQLQPQPQQRTWAAVAAGRPAPQVQQQQQQQQVSSAVPPGLACRQVWELGPHAELLLSKAVPLPGREQQPLLVEVVDVVSSKMQEAAAAAPGLVPCLAGAAGLLLLVAGPDEAELEAAVARLAGVLQHAAPAPAVPLVVLAASGGCTGAGGGECRAVEREAPGRRACLTGCINLAVHCSNRQQVLQKHWSAQSVIIASYSR
jgi:hypothetical protein